MKFFILAISVCLFLVVGCSDDKQSNMSQTGDLSAEECSKIGGHLIEGIGCAKDLSIEEMKTMCEKNGMKYSQNLNGCIE